MQLSNRSTRTIVQNELHPAKNIKEAQKRMSHIERGKTFLLPSFALIAVLTAAGCGARGVGAAPTPTPTLTPQQTAAGSTIGTIFLVVVGLVVIINIAMEAYNGLVKQDVRYPLGFLIGLALGLGITYIFRLSTEMGQFWCWLLMLFFWYVIRVRATGVFARVIGAFWALVLLALIVLVVGVLFADWKFFSLPG